MASTAALALRDAGPRGVEDLPDLLLGAILATAGRECGAAICLTCRRWRRLFWSEPALWRRVAVDFSGLEFARLAPEQQQAAVVGKAAMLQRVARFLREADLNCECRRDQAALLLESLQPEVLTALRLLVSACGPYTFPVVVATEAVLRRATALTRLVLDRTYLLEDEAGVLGALTQLRHLQMWDAQDAVVAGVVPTLRRLTCLHLNASSALPSDVGAAVRQLPDLVHLELCDRGSLPPLALPAPAPTWPALRSFSLDCEDGLLEVLGWRMHCCIYNDGAEAAPDGQLWLRGLGLPDPEADDAHSPAAPLHQLLAALLPPARTSRHPGSLGLEGCCLEARHWEGCPLLASLTELFVLDHYGPSSTRAADVDPADVDALLRQATGLRCLDMCLPSSQLPPAAAQLRGLTKLTLRGRQLERLPAAPCLSGLLVLALDDEYNMRHLPPALPAATALQCLDLRRCHFDLERQDATVLLRLPALRWLLLRHYSPGCSCYGRRPISNNLLRLLCRHCPELQVWFGKEVVAEGGQLIRTATSAT